MSDEELLARKISSLRKRRGVARASITRLGTRLQELESTRDHPSTIDIATQLNTKLETLDADFKALHLQLVDLIEDVEEIEKEQDTLDEHDDRISDFQFRCQRLCVSTAPPTSSLPTTAEKEMLSRRLSRLERSISSALTSITGLAPDHDDTSLFEQYQEQMTDFKGELARIYQDMLTINLPESDDLISLHSDLENNLFECSHLLRKRLTLNITKSPTVGNQGVKLPRLDVPTFDGDILHWRQFWEQFCISIHDRSDLSDTEKLVYLQTALKSGSAKNTIEGLSRSGEHYSEAIDCLQARYDRPRLIHQAHVKQILDAPPLREGNGKELRKLHDTIQQHVRALKSMSLEPSAPFITSVLELKLDQHTMFEWQQHSQSHSDVPHYNELLQFIDYRAQASEVASPHTSKKPNVVVHKKSSKSVTSFASSTETNGCLVCRGEKHPLYVCQKFKGLSHRDKISTIKVHNVCMNCLTTGHHVKDCKSVHRCRKCQKPHHTLLHIEDESQPNQVSSPNQMLSLSEVSPPNQVSSNTAVKLRSKCLLMTCRVIISSPSGRSIEARCLLDSASSASFVSERVTQCLRLPRSFQSISVSGVTGLVNEAPNRSISSLIVSPIDSPLKKISITAIVVPKVTCDLPTHPVPFSLEWTHISELPLSDPTFGLPGRIDALFGVDVFVEVLLQGRRTGPPGSPVAFETEFGWVLGGNVQEPNKDIPEPQITTYHSLVVSTNDLLRRFWEIEEAPVEDIALSMEERTVVRHYQSTHSRAPNGRFIVPLPKKPNLPPIGESRSRAIKRFLSLERSLSLKGRFSEVDHIMREYLDLGHAEVVPYEDLRNPRNTVFYLPMHIVYKDSSTTTKIRPVFDASAKSTTGVSLNDTLLVGPTVHSTLVDVLLRFRLHRIALTTDVTKMYRAIELSNEDKDSHRFVWRSTETDTVTDYRMTRLTFGVSASSFAANMSVKQNAIDLAHEYPLAAKAVIESFYVDDGLTGANTVEEAIQLQMELQALFSRGGFTLQKWNSNSPEVLQFLHSDIRDSREIHAISEHKSTYTKTLGLEWDTKTDQFRLNPFHSSLSDDMTKRSLVSDVAKIFDVMGWFAPVTIKAKILLQRLWEAKIDWDDPVPPLIQETWLKWKSELPLLSKVHIPRCYFTRNHNTSFELHGFSDASEDAYAAVVYLRSEDKHGQILISLIYAKSRVAPIQRLTIPRLELCGARLLTQLLHHAKHIYSVPLSRVFAWTDSTIVLSWLHGSPRRFKTFVGNRVSYIIDHMPAERWRHVSGIDNPADAPSRGLLPSELLSLELWWKGPSWLYRTQEHWPAYKVTTSDNEEEEMKVACHVHVSNTHSPTPIIPPDRFSTFQMLLRVSCWVFRFVAYLKTKSLGQSTLRGPKLTVEEINEAEAYWLSIAQRDCFPDDIVAILSKSDLRNNSPLLPLRPYLDGFTLLRVGGRMTKSNISFSQRHPIILHSKHSITRLIIRSEHLRLIHAGPTLLIASLHRRFHIINLKKAVRSIIRQCITCAKLSARPETQLMGQLPSVRVTPGIVFEKVGVDYAGPVSIKYGHVRRPTIVKAYVCCFVSLTVRAVHLELVSNLTSEAFIACLRRFISRRGHPELIWSDHGTNFVGANRELKEFSDFLIQEQVQGEISQFCVLKKIQWKFIPERSPHFGGIWEAAVKSMKLHLKKVISNVNLTFEELTTVLAQIEACLNSRPLTPIQNDGIEALTPGHFLIGHPLMALPDPTTKIGQKPSLLRRWEMCQSLVEHFWKRWSSEYLVTLNRFNKWRVPRRNVTVGDLVLLREDNVVPTQWPMARVVDTHPGEDGLVRAVTLKTTKGVYKRPINKVVVLLPQELD